MKGPPSSFPNRYFSFLLYFIFLFLLSEIILRFSYFESIRFRLDDKIIHCLNEEAGLFSSSPPWIRLCPNTDVTLYHPEKNSLYRFRSNSAGERLSSPISRNSIAPEKEVWVLGDSVAMGYLVSDQETVSWQLQHSLEKKNTKKEIRNLGVDAVGSLGIRKRLEEVLEHSSSPEAAYWIYHISDLTDSFREESLLHSYKKQSFVKIAYYLSKYSANFNAFKILYERWKPETAENLVTPSGQGVLDKNHPHRIALVSLFDFVKEKKIPLVLVFLPEPTADYKPLLDSELVKEVRQIALDSKIRVLDLQKPIYQFWNQGKQEIFIRQDGHPNRYLYEFIAQELEKDLNQY